MSTSETITRTDLTNILNEVLPTVGGSLQCYQGEYVTAYDSGTYWSLQTSTGLIDESTMPLAMLCDGTYWLYASVFVIGDNEFVFPYDLGARFFEDGADYEVDIYYIKV